jgi:hypothetical protein
MSSESKVTVITKILGKDYETSASASATATGVNSQEIADKISKFISTQQAQAIGETTWTGQSKNGFYPLYLSEELAIQKSNTNPPSAYSHNINGTFWFMPNKINNVGLYHGDNSNNLSPFIVPNSPRLLNQMLIESDVLYILKEIVVKLDLLEFFQNTFEPVDGPVLMNKYTLQPPINKAFEDPQIATLISSLNNDQLIEVLLNHVIEGSIESSKLYNGQIIKTLGSLELQVLIESGKVYFVSPGSTAEVIYADIAGTNGVIHVLNKVLLPNL